MRGEAISGDASPDAPQPDLPTQPQVFLRVDGYSGGNWVCDHCNRPWTEHIAPGCQCPEHAVTDEPTIPLTNHHKAHMANGPLLAHWSHETRHILVMEFIKEQQLFPALNTFLKGKLR